MKTHLLSVSAILNDIADYEDISKSLLSVPSVSFAHSERASVINTKDLHVTTAKKRVRSYCCVEGCPKRAKARGRCNSHGGGTYCSAQECINFAVSHGKCITHGVRFVYLDSLSNLMTCVGWKTMQR